MAARKLSPGRFGAAIPEQARARACENQVYVVSSTLRRRVRNWMLTAVYGQDGSVLAQAKKWGAVASRKWT